MSENIIFGSTPDVENKDRVFSSESEIPAANSFGVGLAVVKQGPKLKISDGSSWTDVGSGSVPEGVILESQRNQPNGFAGLDAAGDLVGNLIPRKDTLANLLTVVGSEGELASATDTAAIVKFNGISTPGDVFYANPMGSYFPEVRASLCNSDTTASHTPVAQASLCPRQEKVFGFYSGANAVKISYDGINFSSVSNSVDGKFAASIDGKTLIRVPTAAGVKAQKSVFPFATWTDFTTNIAATSVAMGAPQVVSTFQALSIQSGGGTNSALLDFTADTVTTYQLPSAGSWQLFASQNPGSLAMAIAAIGSTNKVALFRPDLNVAGWVAADLPLALGTNPFALFTKNKVLIGTQNSPVAFVSNYSPESTFTSLQWSQIALPISAGVARYRCSNAEGVMLSDGGGQTVWMTKDFTKWEEIDLSLSVDDVFYPVRIHATKSGFLALGTSYGVHVGNDNSLSGFARFLWGAAANVTTVMPSINGDDIVLPGASTAMVFVSKNGLPSVSMSKAVTTTTGTVNIAAGVTFLAVNHAADQAAFTLNLPPMPYNGLEVVVRFRKAVTTLTVGTQSSPLSQTINGAATATMAITAGQVKRFILDGTDWAVV